VDRRGVLAAVSRPRVACFTFATVSGIPLPDKEPSGCFVAGTIGWVLCALVEEVRMVQTDRSESQGLGFEVPGGTRRIALISTGGTIEKTYDALTGVVSNQVSNLDILLGRLELRGVEISRVPLMNKDSLDMTPEDHTLIAQTAGSMAQVYDGVVVVHGTDRLSHTGHRMVELLTELSVPIVLTGAMRPYELRTTDAVQNMTEALLAVQVLPTGVWLAMHNQVLPFPGVRKNRDTHGFEWVRGHRE